MCDEYEDERMVAFWRRLEELEQRTQTAPETGEPVEPHVRIEPDPAATPKAKSRPLVH